MEARANEQMAAFVEVANKRGGHLQLANIRWQIANERSVTLLPRKGERKTIATISPTHNAEFWPSWEPIVKEWLAERAANGKKRINHDKFANGEMP